MLPPPAGRPTVAETSRRSTRLRAEPKKERVSMASPAPSGCVSSIPKCPLLVSPCAASGGKKPGRRRRAAILALGPQEPLAKAGPQRQVGPRPSRTLPPPGPPRAVRSRLSRRYRWLAALCGQAPSTSSIFGTLCLDLLLPFLVGVSEVGGSVDLQSFPGRV